MMSLWKSGPDRRLHPVQRMTLVSLILLLMMVSMAVLMGCTKSQTSQETTPSSESEVAVEGTQTINLNMGPQDSCVTFVPKSTTIHVGDRVNFNTNAGSSVTVNVPAGLFSASDTTIVVTRGPNLASPQARSPGSYPLSSSPRACSDVTGGGGPIIVVDEGTK